MEISAMVVDWRKLQQAYNDNPDEFLIGEVLEEDDGAAAWVRPARASQHNDSFVFNEEAGQLFDALKGELPAASRAALQEFFVFCCPQQWVDDDRLPPQDLAGQEVGDIAAAIEPAKVKGCLERMQQVHLGEVMALARRHVPVPGGQAMKSEAAFGEFIDMWVGVFREAAERGWGVLIMIG